MPQVTQKVRFTYPAPWFVILAFFLVCGAVVTARRSSEEPSSQQENRERAVHLRQDLTAFYAKLARKEERPAQEIEHPEPTSLQEGRPQRIFRGTQPLHGSEKTLQSEEELTKKTEEALRQLQARIPPLGPQSNTKDEKRKSKPSGPTTAITVRKEEPTARTLFPPGGPPSRAPSRGDLSGSNSPDPTPSSSPTPTPTPEIPFVTGQARGYSMLYAMQPEARQTVEREVEILLEARLTQNHIGVLVDGTFGWDPEYLAGIISRINGEERSLVLTLYLANGPTQRILERSPIRESFPQTPPEIFREEIQYDPATREEFRERARRITPLLLLNAQGNRESRNIVVPMLEDNLDTDSYSAIRDLTEEELGTLAEIVRNPCPDCYDGNDAARLGGRLEIHGREDLLLLEPGDAFSLDGTGYVTTNEPQSSQSFSEQELERLLEIFARGGLAYFGLWRADRQGLTEGPTISPAERFYALPTIRQENVEQKLLRAGLREVLQ